MNRTYAYYATKARDLTDNELNKQAAECAKHYSQLQNKISTLSYAADNTTALLKNIAETKDKIRIARAAKRAFFSEQQKRRKQKKKTQLDNVTSLTGIRKSWWKRLFGG